jgi:anthranilate synthase component 1
VIAPRIAGGGALALVRRLDGAADPLALYRALSDGGSRPGTLLFQTADAASDGPLRSFIVERAALSATCRGRAVTLAALSQNGAAALDHVVREAAGKALIADQSPRSAVLVFPPRADVADAEARLRAPSPMDALRAMTSFRAEEHGEAHAIFCAGVFAYDMVDAFEALPAPRSDPLSYPDFSFWLAESLVVVDPRVGRTALVCTAFGSDDAERSAAAYHDSTARLAALVDRCRAVIDGGGRAVSASAATGPSLASSRVLPAAEAAPVAPVARACDVAREGDEVSVDLDDEGYASVVRTLKERILAGDVFQVVPSRTFRAPCPSAVSAYEALRSINPSPYMFFVAGEDHVLFGASPEASVRVGRAKARGGDAERTVEIRPIAGTRRRGRKADGAIDVDLDDRLQAELALDEKEIAEHMMLVDLARNDVARVSRPGTRRADRLLSVERYSHVMHLVSRVTGALREDLDALHAIAASMNMGTLVGAPKVRAAELLRGAEATKRGPYGGAVGYLTGEGDFDSAVVIRSALVKDGVAHVRAGAGVVFDSDPLAEADETRRKAESVLAALRLANERARAEAQARATGATGAASAARNESNDASNAAVAGGASTSTSGPPEIVLIDNFDSFTWNLVDAFQRLGARVRVLRNTVAADVAVEEAIARRALIVLSPGPGGPEEAGSCIEIIAKAKGRAPLLGVCLGHQAIVKEAGGEVGHADAVVHGKVSRLAHDGQGPMRGLPSPLLVGRYHSLATRRLPPRFTVHAAIGDMAMAISDAGARQIGLQFHPESILTPAGDLLLRNILAFAAERRAP